MTEQEKSDWKQKVKEVILDHLIRTCNYPDCGADSIFNQVPFMWTLLGMRGLIKDGMTYEQFYQDARQAYLKAEIHRVGIVF